LKKFLEKRGIKLEDKKMVLIIRIIIALIAVIAIVFALLKIQFIYRYVLDYAWCALGASFGPAILLALHYKKFNKWGVVTSLVSGSLLTYLWSVLKLSNYIKIYNLVLIFFVTLIIAWLVSELTSNVKKS
jgi:sodium/proline symporter